MKRVAVIGAGITGLCAAYELQRKGFSVTVFEKSSRAGGLIQSRQVGGYNLELGPNTVLAGGAIWDELIDSLGLHDRLIVSNPQAKKRFIVRAGKLVTLPGNPLTTPILSFGAKLRLLCEPLVRKRPTSCEDESLADFVKRRCGAEFLKYIVNPVVSGIYAGTPEKLSVRHAFPLLWNLEGNSGSLFGGMVKKMFGKKKQPKVRKQMISFTGGLQELTDKLAEKLGDSLKLDTTVEQLRKSGDVWLLSIKGNDDWLKFDEVIETVPLHCLARTANSEITREQLDEYARVPYAPARVWHLGFDRKDVPHPLDGFGFLVPECENKHVLGVLFASSLFPNRTPKDKILLTVMTGGMRSPEMLYWPPEKLNETVSDALRQYLGITVSPVFAHEAVYDAAIPQYGVGYGKILGQMEQLESQAGGIHLAGNFRGGISVLNCIENGIGLARLIIAENSK